MSGLAQSLQYDYEGYGTMTGEGMEELQKALQAGSGVDAGSFTGGRALIPESLDQTLVNILHQQEDAVLFQRVKKQPIKSPVHQWDERTEVGADDGAWVSEGGNSQEADQTIARKYETAKYLQTLRKVTIQASISNTIENAMVLEQNAGMLWLIRNVERGMIYGNSSHVAEQPNGVITQIPTSNVLDLRGASANSAAYEDKMNEGSRIIRENFGKASFMLGSPLVVQETQELLRDRIRFPIGEGGMGSYTWNQYPTPFGTMELKEDIFIEEGKAPSASSLTSSRPDAPSISVATSADSDSLFDGSSAGTYYYKVVATNKYGDSPASSEASATVASGEKVTITVTDGSTAGTAFKVYRSEKGASDGSDARYAFTVTRTTSPQDVDDLNTDLPGCSDVFLFTMAPVYDAIEWFQFLPAMKFELYPTNAAVYPFLMLLFGALALKKPVQHIRIKNVAPSQLGWF